MRLLYQPPLRKKCPYSELFWSVFSSIWTEYGEIQSARIRFIFSPNTGRFTQRTLINHDNNLGQNAWNKVKKSSKIR